MTRRRTGWSLRTTVAVSLLLLGLAVLAYHKFWEASILTAAKEHFAQIAHLLPSLEHTSPTQTALNDNGIPITKALVLASYSTQNVSWLHELPSIAPDWQIYRYIADDPNTDYLSVPNPNGREALAYLTFIVDYYRTLPDYIVFVHGHKYAWHQPESMVDKVAALNLTAVSDERYVNLRCQMLHGCTEEDMFYFSAKKADQGGNAVGRFQVKLGPFWREFMAADFGPVPPKIGRRCCSQFAVPRETIHRLPLRFWKHLRSPLLIEDGWHGEHAHQVGLYYEMIWHIIMGKPPVHCPSKNYCFKVYFQDLIHCTGDDENFKVGDGTHGRGWKHTKCTNDMRNATSFV